MTGKWRRFPLVATAAVGVGAALAFAVPAGAAVSVQSQSPPLSAVSLGSKARLDANGAVVFAPIKLACTPGAYTYLTVSVTQAIGNAIASGQTYTAVDECTGTQQKLSVAVTPTQRPFRKGVAFGQATLRVCTDRCKTVVDQHNIQIVK
jgi:hypothetical protein